MTASTMRAEAISVRRGGQPILRAVDCEIRAGELLAVIGPNGAGKSTLLGAMANDLPISSGELTIDGVSLAAYPPLEMARKRAVLPQQSSLDFPLTVREVIALGRTPHRSSPSEDRAFTAYLIDMFSLGELADRPYTRCSGGEQRRTQLARVLAQLMPLEDGAKFLLLDEPTANLDPARALELLEIAKHLTRRGVGVMAILHDPNLVLRVADRVLVLSDGECVADGAPDEVLTPALFERVFEMRIERLEPEHLPHPVLVPMGGLSELPFDHPLFATPITREKRR